MCGGAGAARFGCVFSGLKEGECWVLAVMQRRRGAEAQASGGARWELCDRVGKMVEVRCGLFGARCLAGEPGVGRGQRQWLARQWAAGGSAQDDTGDAERRLQELREQRKGGGRDVEAQGRKAVRERVVSLG